MKKERYLFYLIIISLLVRLLVSPFFILFPKLPHDFGIYLGSGKCMLEGKFLMWDCMEWVDRSDKISQYGVLFSVLTAFWYLIFGENFLMFKLLSILFDILGIVMIYLIAKEFFNKKLAFHLGLLYAFSFIALYSSSVLGNNNNIFMSLFLISIYFMLRKKLLLSSVFYVISVLIKPTPLVIFPVIFYYLLKKYRLKKSLKYCFFTAMIFLIFLLPFIIIAGFEKATYSILFSNPNFKNSYGMSVFSIFKYVTNVNVDYLSRPALILCYILTLFLILRNSLKNKEIELVRNILLFFIVTLPLNNWFNSPYLYFLLPFMIIVFGLSFRGKKLMSNRWVLGVPLIFISLLIYSIIFRWGIVQYSTTDRILLLLSVVLAPLGVFNLLHKVKNKYRLIWVCIILAAIMYEEVHATPLLALPLKSISEKFVNVEYFTVIDEKYGDHIQGNPEVLLAYGAFYGGPAVIIWICLVLLYYTLLKNKFKIKEERLA